jgi:hypothetical protein
MTRRATRASHPGRFWAYRPHLAFDGWRDISPIGRSHDEYGRWTLVLGWAFTGRIIIALNHCSDPDCRTGEAA